MASSLVKLGCVLVAAALVALLLAEISLLPIPAQSEWISTGLVAGAGLAGLGLLLGVMGRMGRRVLPSRCSRCGRTVERGQVYCADHLKLTRLLQSGDQRLAHRFVLVNYQQPDGIHRLL